MCNVLLCLKLTQGYRKKGQKIIAMAYSDNGK